MRNISASANRIALHYLFAKPVFLKSIDFTIGVVRKHADSIPYDTGEIIRRLIELRKDIIKGFRLQALADSVNQLRNVGEGFLKRLEHLERNATPTEANLAAFLDKFPDTSDAVRRKQAKVYDGIIHRATGVPVRDVPHKLMADPDFALESFGAINPYLQQQFNAIKGKMKGAGPGQFAARVKAPKSSVGKQEREGMPFTAFNDLIGCRLVTDGVKDLTMVAATVQKDFNVVMKKNYFTQDLRYNAINYVLAHGPILFEFQLKTVTNELESSLTHDLIYAPEKMVANLSAREKHMVGLVVDITTQLSVDEWRALFMGGEPE